MTAAPAISVVLPVLNGAATIADQLDALATQQFRGDFEVVVVDNGSTDDTVGIVRAVMARDDRFRLVDGSAVRGSAAAARNLGVESARADRIACCDADDIVQPGWLSALDSALDTAEAASGRIEMRTLNPHRDPQITQDFLGSYTVFGLPGYAGGNSAIRRDVYLSLGGQSTSFPGGEDSEFAVRLALAGHEVVYVPEAVVSIRTRTGFIRPFRHSRSLHGALRKIRIAHRFPTPTLRRAVADFVYAGRWLIVNTGYLFDRRRRIKWARELGRLTVLMGTVLDAARAR